MQTAKEEDPSSRPHRLMASTLVTTSPFAVLQLPSTRQARQDLNLQPPVLETGALPIELRTCTKLQDGKLPGGSGYQLRASRGKYWQLVCPLPSDNW